MKELSKVFHILTNSIKGNKKPILPTVLNFPFTGRSIAECVMGSDWQSPPTNEIGSIELKKILANPLFAKIAHVGISGGEPTIRKDLYDICVVIIETLPSVRSISITTNGFHPRILKLLLPKIKKLCEDAGVSFSLNISIDGIGEVHDRIRRFPNGFQYALESMEISKNLNIRNQIQCTVSIFNIFNIGQVRDLGKNLGIDTVFRIATKIPRLNNEPSIESILLNDKQKSFFADFLEDSKTHKITNSLGRHLFYWDLARRLRGNSKRKAPCYFQNQGTLLTAQYELFHCSMSTHSIGNVLKEDAYRLYFSEKSQKIHNDLITNKCPFCWHDQSGAWPITKIIKAFFARTKVAKVAQKAKLGGYVLFLGIPSLLKSKKYKIPNITSCHSIDKLGSEKMKKALLIGCYGGEHVGDAAILGGVLQRLSENSHVDQAIVASIRPNRTHRWVSSLVTNCNVRILNYSSRNIKNVINHINYLVFAGGPLMDLPVLLAKHLAVAVICAKRDIPIIIEGAGIGPFQFKLSKMIVRRILQMASEVRLRTQASVDHAREWRIPAVLTHDPAFDYLKSRYETVMKSNQLPDSLTKILDTEKPVVGVNLRPLWKRYAQKGYSASYISRLEENFLTYFASAIEDQNPSVRYVFFPMNADQYGFSDLNIAYRLSKKISDNIDYHIWEYEPDVDDIILFLNRVKACISMRFHGCIFALSQDLPTIGIDYGIGQKSKVVELFNDFGLKDNVVGVKNIDNSNLSAMIKRVLTNCID